MKKEKTDPVPLEVIQNISFEILKYIRDVCYENGLRYYLAYGTLIGAVRHQGFIPWDDDMDIHMPREDYLKFVEIIKKNPHPYYKLISRETPPAPSYILPKMIDSRTELTECTFWSNTVKLGIFVDIYVLDGAGNSPEEAEDTYQDAFAIYKHWENANTRIFYPGKGKFYTFRKWIQYFPDRSRGVEHWIDQHSAFCSQKPFDDYEYIGALFAGTPQASRNIWKREAFGNGTDVLFNGEAFRAPADWDAVLRPEYGGYMEPPAPYLQHPHHHNNLMVPDYLINEFGGRN